MKLRFRKQLRVGRLLWLVVALAFALYLRANFSCTGVYGTSMLPNVIHRDYCLIYHTNDIVRGDAVTIRHVKPNGEKMNLLKRVIGLPGETLVLTRFQVFIKYKNYLLALQEDYVPWYSNDNYIDGQIEVTLKDDEVYVMGDNRPISYDSRSFGPVKMSEIDGKVIAILARFP